MTVKELIEQLKNLDGDVLVVMSSDSEGNNFSPTAEAEASHYTAETTYSGQCHHPDDVPECPNAKPCVCLWPTN